MTTGSFEAARAANAFLHLGCEDQQSLLEVLEDYFCLDANNKVNVCVCVCTSVIQENSTQKKLDRMSLKRIRSGGE